MLYPLAADIKPVYSREFCGPELANQTRAHLRGCPDAHGF
jgi:hypothetical protein